MHYGARDNQFGVELASQDDRDEIVLTFNCGQVDQPYCLNESFWKRKEAREKLNLNVFYSL